MGTSLHVQPRRNGMAVPLQLQQLNLDVKCSMDVCPL